MEGVFLIMLLFIFGFLILMAVGGVIQNTRLEAPGGR